MRLLFAPVLLSAATVLSACASTDSPTRSERLAETLADPRVGEEVERICFARGIDNFYDEREESVVLRRGVNDDYLVVTRTCPDLDDAQSLGLESTSGCLRRFDRIRIFRSAFGATSADVPGFNRCQIDRIYRWNQDAVEDESEDAATD